MQSPLRLRRRRRLLVGLGLVALLATLLVLLWPSPPRRVLPKLPQVLRGHKTVAQRLQEVGPAARARLQPAFGEAQVPYPPAQLRIVGFKSEKRLDLYARAAQGPWRFLRSYPILAASGKLGPKLRYGDYQVPEGLYRVESLNPNSRYHLALRVSYPSPADLARAEAGGRTHLGGDIMIHGSNRSVGCLAMGDVAAEELFVLAAETGLSRIRIILAPVDFRVRKLPKGLKLPVWTNELYRQVRAELKPLPVPPQPSRQGN